MSDFFCLTCICFYVFTCNKSLFILMMYRILLYKYTTSYLSILLLMDFEVIRNSAEMNIFCVCLLVTYMHLGGPVHSSIITES